MTRSSFPILIIQEFCKPKMLNAAFLSAVCIVTAGVTVSVSLAGEQPGGSNRDKAKPIEGKAAGAKPAEAKTTAVKASEAKPAAVKAAEAKPAAVKASEAKPAAVKAAEAKPAAVRSAETKLPAGKLAESASVASGKGQPASHSGSQGEPAKKHSADDSTSAKHSAEHSKAHIASKKMLIPPPPPEIPLIPQDGGSHSLSTSGIVLDYLSKPELDRLKERLVTSLAKVQAEKTDYERTLKEKSGRIEQFDQLYKEGVVSRRELEAAHKELTDLQRSQSDIDMRLQDAQTDLDRVVKQLDKSNKTSSRKK